MTKTITIAHQKGGVGKSTLALNLAYRFSKEVSTALTDTDPQGSIMRLQGIVSGIDIIDYPYSNNQAYDVIFIDTPPYLTETMLSIFLQSDFVLIPTKAGVTDIMAIDATIALVKQAQKKKSNLKAGIVLNMIKPRVGITEQAKSQLQHYDFPILAEIKDRVSYNNTFLTGGIFSGSDLLAQEEINLLSSEILNLL
ncbi:ParA family protein [bacterium]|nr:MAG: ParA family protein [bacterium]